MYSSDFTEPSFEMIACSMTVPEICALFAISGYSGGTWLTSAFSSIFPMTLILVGLGCGTGLISGALGGAPWTWANVLVDSRVTRTKAQAANLARMDYLPQRQ